MTATGRRLVDLSHPIPRTPSRAAGTKGLRGFAASWSNIFETKLAETALGRSTSGPSAICTVCCRSALSRMA